MMDFTIANLLGMNKFIQISVTNLNDRLSNLRYRIQSGKLRLCCTYKGEVIGFLVPLEDRSQLSSAEQIAEDKISFSEFRKLLPKAIKDRLEATDCLSLTFRGRERLLFVSGRLQNHFYIPLVGEQLTLNGQEIRHPTERELAEYPSDWETIAQSVKERSGWKCQECGKQCRRPGQNFLDFAFPFLESGQMDSDDLDHPQRFTLTVAHLNHKPEDCRPENLKALCAPCHCQMDLKAMGTKQMLKRERQGQLSLELKEDS